MDRFASPLVRHFGARWLRTGALTLSFCRETPDDEALRLWVDPLAPPAPPDRVRLGIEAADGDPVCEGSASVGTPPSSSTLRGCLSRSRGASRLRWIPGVRVGDETELATTRLHACGSRAAPTLADTLRAALEEDPARHAGLTSLTSVSAIVKGMHASSGLRLPGAVVRRIGALDLRILQGPLVPDRDYEVQQRVVALDSVANGDEHCWIESTLWEPGGGDALAVLLVQHVFQPRAWTQV